MFGIIKYITFYDTIIWNLRDKIEMNGETMASNLWLSDVFHFEYSKLLSSFRDLRF